MNAIRKLTGTCLLLSACLCANAQFDGGYDEVGDWTLDLPEDEEPKPQHKEYKNALYLQFSPSQYIPAEDYGHLHLQEIMVGYKRNVQVQEDLPFFVEAGLNAKYGFSSKQHDGLKYSMLTFRLPVNVIYKQYLSKTKDIAVAPYAGVSCRAIAFSKADDGTASYSPLRDGDWKPVQISWQVGARFYYNRYFAGVSYSRDFRDSSKFPCIHECGVHVGVSF